MPLALSMFGTVVYFLDDLKRATHGLQRHHPRRGADGEDMHKQRVEALTGIKTAQASHIPSQV